MNESTPTLTPTEQARHDAQLAMAPAARPDSVGAHIVSELDEIMTATGAAITVLREIREALSTPIQNSRTYHRDGIGVEKEVVRSARDAIDAAAKLLKAMPDLAAVVDATRRTLRRL